MLLNEPCNCIQLNPPEATGTLQGDGFQPEFCYHVLAPDVDVGRLSPIQGHEEEAIRADSKDRRHFIAILSRQAEISTIFRSALSWTPVRLTSWCAGASRAFQRRLESRHAGLEAYATVSGRPLRSRS